MKECEKSNRKILLVEDNKLAARAAGLILSDKGYCFDIATTGMDALNKIDGDIVYDLVLLDIGLPDMSGIDVAKHIRNKSKQASVYIAALTASSHDTKEGADAINAFFLKPLRIEMLEQVFKHQ